LRLNCIMLLKKQWSRDLISMGNEKEPKILPCDRCGEDARNQEYLFRVCPSCNKKTKESMRETAEVRLGLWLYNRGFIGLITLAFDFLFNKAEKVSEKIYKEVFA